MRLLADENFGPTVVRSLREAGHDVVSALESMSGAPDEVVLARAVGDDRILVTFDKDFGELAFGRGVPARCGIILFRFTPAGRDADARRVCDTLASGEDWTGAFWTVGDHRIRRAPLPRANS